MCIRPVDIWHCIDRQRYLISASVILWTLAAFLAFRPLEGFYGGPLVDGFAVETELLLVNGNAFFVHEDDPEPIGPFARKNGRLVLNFFGDEWLLKRTIFGFEMVNHTNRSQRYEFKRKWTTGFTPAT